jgi:hypothetical protein
VEGSHVPDRKAGLRGIGPGHVKLLSRREIGILCGEKE